MKIMSYVLCQQLTTTGTNKFSCVTLTDLVSYNYHNYVPSVLFRLASVLLTCIGIGTTILLFGPQFGPPLTFSLFHFARRFWNQIFIWTCAILGNFCTQDFLGVCFLVKLILVFNQLQINSTIFCVWGGGWGPMGRKGGQMWPWRTRIGRWGPW